MQSIVYIILYILLYNALHKINLFLFFEPFVIFDVNTDII